MSKKMNKLVLLSALMIAIIGTFGTVSAEVYNLTADGGDEMTAFKVGEIEVTNDEYNLYVTFSITHEDDWAITETHLHVANESEDIPQTKKGNPKVGKFEYSNSTYHEYTIPIPEGCNEGDNVTIAAHAAVQLFVEYDPIAMEDIFRYESAWGEGDEFNEGRNWAMFITYTIPPAVLPTLQ